MADVANICWFVAGSSGLSDFSDGTALTGAKNLAAKAASGRTYSYRAEHPTDKSIWENGSGLYNGTTLARTTIEDSSNAGAKVNFAVAPVVLLVPMKRDWDGLAAFEALANNGLQPNGGAEVSQENGNSSVTLTGTGSLQLKYILDGWMAAYRGTFVAAGQQVTDAPPGYRNSLKFTVGTAQGALGANDELSVLIPITGYHAARLKFGAAGAMPTSFGFWVKAHRTGTYSGSLRNSAKNRAYPFNFAVSSADTWEYKTVTINGDTSGTWLTDAGVGIWLNICIAGGSSRVGTAAAWAGSDYSGVTSTTNGVAATSDTFQMTGLVVLPGLDLPAQNDAHKLVKLFRDAERDAMWYFELAGLGAPGQCKSGTQASIVGTCAPKIRQPDISSITTTPGGIEYGVSLRTASGFSISSQRSNKTGAWSFDSSGWSGLTNGNIFGLADNYIALDARH